MARTYYSTVFDRSAAEVWAHIRDFGHYAWAGVPGETVIEGGKPGDAVGAVRNVDLGERHIRQRLVAHSDAERFYTYDFLDPVPFPIKDYRATLRVTPVTDGDRAFVEWSAIFDCAEDAREHWASHLANEGFARWLGALRKSLAA